MWRRAPIITADILEEKLNAIPRFVQMTTLRYIDDTTVRAVLLTLAATAAPPMTFLDLRQLEAHPLVGVALKARSSRAQQGAN